MRFKKPTLSAVLIVLLIAGNLWQFGLAMMTSLRIGMAREQVKIISEAFGEAALALKQQPPRLASACASLDYMQSYYPSGTIQPKGSGLDEVVERMRALAMQPILAELVAQTNQDFGTDLAAWQTAVKESTSTIKFKWQTQDHYSTYPLDELLHAMDVQLPKSFPSRQDSLGCYLYCQQSGALLHAMPAKSAYGILIFPRPNSRHFDFKVHDAQSLKQEHLDVEALARLLNSGAAGMGGAPSPLRIQACSLEERDLMGNSGAR